MKTPGRSLPPGVCFLQGTLWLQPSPIRAGARLGNGLCHEGGVNAISCY
jgi:hypothetical protein